MAHATLYRIDAQASSAASTTAGAEPTATAFDAAFATDGTDYWNAVGGPVVTVNYGSNPLSVNLNTSLNTSSSVYFNIIGGQGIPIDNGAGWADPLAKDFIATYPQNGHLDFSFSGLQPNAPYKLVLYGSANRDSGRTGTFSVDLDGNGTKETPATLVNNWSSTPDPAQNNLMAVTLTGSATSSTGEIRFSFTDNDGDEVDFAGAQLFMIPRPDLVYNPLTGNVRLYADGVSFSAFNLESAGQFSGTADFSDLTADTGYPSGPTDNTASALGWVSGGSLFGVGFDGPAGSINTPFADLGNVFPTGLDFAGLNALLTNNQWGSIGSGGSFDLVVQVPEPGSLALLSLGLVGLFGYSLRRKQR